MHHEKIMQRCIELAQKGRGLVKTNPMVGAVLVRHDAVIAEGWHREFGALHAEVDLLQSTEQKISSEDVLFVNLEPCCHHGKQPPCVQEIINAGIKTVVIGMVDPNPAMQGKGIAALRNAGVDVHGPVLPEPCRRLNRGFVSLQEQGRPWITCKRARTRDGRTSDNGKRMKITSKVQDEWSHAHLRATHDAILVGVGTIVEDNPLLTCRMQGAGMYPLHRIILDPQNRIPSDARVLNGDAPTTVITSDVVQYDNNGFDMQALMLYCRDVLQLSSILVEGGQCTWKSFFDAGVVDEEVVLVG